MSGIRLFVGGDPARLRGEPVALHGDRCFTAAQPPRSRLWAAHVAGLLDSGAFSDPPEKRLTPETALERQLRWEARVSTFWGAPWQAEALVSYDRLIDEVWIAGERHKRRWSVTAAEGAVAETIEAAHYLAAHRSRLGGRRLVLACQGVDAMQYDECVTEVLAVAQPADWIGLGGWCILGRWTSWLPVFWATLYRVLPRIQAAGIRHVHIFGVLYERALAGLLWLADHHGLSVSTDSSAPLLAYQYGDPKKAGLRAPTWQANVHWWTKHLRTLHESAWYRAPRLYLSARQEVLFDEVGI